MSVAALPLRRPEALAEPPLTAAQQRLVLSVLRFIEQRVNQIAPRAKGPPREDLVQAGRFGAARAARRFDPARGLHFLTFASSHIGGAILDHLRGERRQSRVKQAASTAGRTYLAEAPDTFKVLFDDPETNQRRLNEAADRLLAAMAAGVAATPPGPEDDLIDQQSRQVALATVRETIGQLEEDERTLFNERYVEGKKLHQIAEEHAVSLNTVRRRHDRFLDESARALHARGITEAPPIR
jgi:RNA polymerase sigma factor (sigma-70 family)